MDESIFIHNIASLDRELEWLAKLVDTRLKLFFELDCEYPDLQALTPPDLAGDSSHFARFIVENRLTFAERIVLILALAPHLKAEILDGLFIKNQAYDKAYTEFGGIREQTHSGFMPTGETALFLFGNTNLKDRLSIQYIFSDDFLFARQNVLFLDPVRKGEPYWNGRLTISKEFLNYFTHGDKVKPTYSPDFPAKYVTTQLEWEDLVLTEKTMLQVYEIKDWLEYGDEILTDYGLGRMLSPGYKCLFHGPPGTGKTLTATLLGKVTGRDVYRIDLSQITSKYIGETEKNLAKVFDQAGNQKWILFFDEADALFGKRTETKSSNDRFANQEVAYLLQRIEDYPGVVILASNLKDNIDDAFSRRFQGMTHFPLPAKEERLKLWKQSFPPKIPLEKEIDLVEVAEKYELSGGSMMNVIRFCALKALKEEKPLIRRQFLENGIRRELEKEGKVLF